MLVRIVYFLVGATLSAGGGFLLWTNRMLAWALFPPSSAGVPWVLVLGVLGLAGGVVFLVNAVHPRPERRARLAAEAARREEALGAADAYYAGRARATDRDWRSGDLPRGPAPRAEPEPAPRPDPFPAALQPVPQSRLQPAAQPAPTPTPARPAAVKPVASSTPPPAPEPTPFPAQATLSPIPQASEPPPAPAAPPQPSPMPAADQAPEPAPPPMPAPPPVQAAAPAPAPEAPPAPVAPPPAAPAPEPAAPSTFDAIRAAIAGGQLPEADRLLNVARDTAQGAALAELTGLAGDHAAAAGRQSNAKWLWRLALKRFGELNLMDSPAARQVAESLRLADG